MNLETFKARARRKLELPNRNTQPESARAAMEPAADPVTSALATSQPATTKPEITRSGATNPRTTGQQQSAYAEKPNSNPEKFAAAMSQAHDEELKRNTTVEPQTPAPKSDTKTRSLEARSMPSLTSTPAATPTPAATRTTAATPTPAAPPTQRATPVEPQPAYPQTPTQTPTEASMPQTERTSEATELSKLRALLLGDSYKDQRDQIDVVDQRTQAGINNLRKDMDARLDNLNKYVSQLEQSILNSVEVRAEESDQQQWAIVAESTEARVQEHNERIDAFDERLTTTLSSLRAKFEADRESDRAYLKKELAEANARTDKLLDNVSSRLETSIASIEARLSKQLTNQSAGLVAESESTVSNLRAQLGNLIDERVRSFNEKQNSGLGELRDILLANTKQLNGELKLQTEQQRNTLNAHRTEMEKQLNSAIHELNQSKVSHKDLAQLLGRLADRLKHL